LRYHRFGMVADENQRTPPKRASVSVRHDHQIWWCVAPTDPRRQFAIAPCVGRSLQDSDTRGVSISKTFSRLSDQSPLKQLSRQTPAV
jgi:hypothetical protein